MESRDGDPPGLGDMPPEEFRLHAHAVVDWIADYLAKPDRYPVLSRVRPGDVRSALGMATAPEGEPFGEILEDFEQIIVPGMTHWNHPGFMAYFATSGSAPGILGEMLASALNVNTMVWRSSPAATELEEHALAWLRDLLGLPAAFDGVINDTASTSSLYALAAAREAALSEASEWGLGAAPRARVYASQEAHSSIDKAVLTLGLGRQGLRRVEVDDEFRLRPEALRTAIDEDLAAGIRPIAVTATVGTTSTTAVDPVEAVADVAEEYGLWLHVDAAYGGSAAIVTELRPLFRGWERADSIVVNPHKWLFTPLDCSVLYCSRPRVLRQAFSLTPEYLRTAEEAIARNLMDYGVALGRRFRSLKLWFVLRYFGPGGLARRIRAHIGLARELASWIDAEEGWERAAPVPFSTVAFRFAPPGLDAEDLDRLNEAILAWVNESGEAFLSHTRVGGRVVIRVAVDHLRTSREHVARTWELLREAARQGSAAG